MVILKDNQGNRQFIVHDCLFFLYELNNDIRNLVTAINDKARRKYTFLITAIYFGLPCI